MVHKLVLIRRMLTTKTLTNQTVKAHGIPKIVLPDGLTSISTRRAKKKPWKQANASKKATSISILFILHT